jgi:hypothetical protein
MVLTGFRLILLICLFVSSALYVTARQTSQRQAQPIVAAATASLATEDEALGPDIGPIDATPPRAPEPKAEAAATVRAGDASALTAAVESVHQEPPRKVEAVAIDPVRQAGADMPLDGNVDGAESAAGLRKGFDGNDVVAVPVDKQDGGARNNIGGQILRSGEHPRKADDPRHRTRTAKADVKRHHRALAKADKRKRVVRKAKIRKLVVQKSVKRRRRMANPAPALRRVTKRKLKPLAAAKRVTGAGLGCMW